MEQKNQMTTDLYALNSYALLEEMQGWQEEEEYEEILEFCANHQRFSFKQNFHTELDKITSDICETERENFISVKPKNFMKHLFNFINENPTSTLETYKTKTDYYLLMNLRNQTDIDRSLMIGEIYKVWGQ